MTLFTTADAVQFTHATAAQVDYFVRVAKIIVPAKPASRRGVSHGFDFRNLVEIRVAVEMLNCGIQAKQIALALEELRQHWSLLRDFSVSREKAAVLAVFRSFREPTRPPSIQIGPADMLREFAQFVIHVSVPLPWIVNELEAKTGLLWGSWY
jgi:hypothetical protein